MLSICKFVVCFYNTLIITSLLSLCLIDEVFCFISDLLGIWSSVIAYVSVISNKITEDRIWMANFIFWEKFFLLITNQSSCYNHLETENNTTIFIFTPVLFLLLPLLDFTKSQTTYPLFFMILLFMTNSSSSVREG